MNKLTSFILSILLLLNFDLLVGCNKTEQITSLSKESSTESSSFEDSSSENTYTIQYLLDGGENNSSNPLQYTVGEIVVLLPAKKEGYNFLGWSCEGEQKNEISAVDSGNLIFTALWEIQVIYTLKDDAYVASGIDKNLSQNSHIEILDTYNGKSVTAIADEAFAYNSDIQSIKIPNSIQSIGEKAFTACSSLKTIIIPEGVQTIKREAFSNCESLSVIFIPDSVISLACCFEGSLNLSIITEFTEEQSGWNTWWRSLGYTQQGYKKYANVQYNCTVYEDKQNIIYRISNETNKASVFLNMGNISEVVIPKSVNDVPVVAIDKNAFNGNTFLAKVVLADSIERIEFQAFADCYNLISLTLEGNEPTIDSTAFNNCEKLIERIDKETASKMIRKDDFYFYHPSEDEYILLAYIGTQTKLVLPERINFYKYTIGENAFKKNTFIEELTISEAVAKIEISAFERCSVLRRVFFEEGITEIKSSAFKGCEELSSLSTATIDSFPRSLLTIGAQAFFGCNFYGVWVPNSIISIGNSAIGMTKDVGLIDSEINAPKVYIQTGSNVYNNAQNWISDTTGKLIIRTYD